MTSSLDWSNALGCILTAQEFLNSGDHEAVKDILMKLKENGTEPVIQRALHNFLNGGRKLLQPIKSAKKTTHSRYQAGTKPTPIKAVPKETTLLGSTQSQEATSLPKQYQSSQDENIFGTFSKAHNNAVQVSGTTPLQSIDNKLSTALDNACQSTPANHATEQRSSFTGSVKPTPSQPSATMPKRWRRKMLNLGPPSRKIATPKSDAKQKIVIRKLEESPINSSEQTLPCVESNRVPTLLSKALFPDVQLLEGNEADKLQSPSEMEGNSNKRDLSSHTTPETETRLTEMNQDLSMGMDLDKYSLHNGTGSSYTLNTEYISHTQSNAFKDIGGLCDVLNNSSNILSKQNMESAKKSVDALKNLGSISEDSEPGVALLYGNKKSCCSDSGFHDVVSVGGTSSYDYQTPSRATVLAQKGNSGNSVPCFSKEPEPDNFKIPVEDEIKNAIETSKSEQIVKPKEPNTILLHKDALMTSDAPPQSSFKIPAAPVPRIPANAKEEGIGAQQQPSSGLTEKPSVNVTPNAKSKDLSELIMQLKNSSSKQNKGESSSTTKKNKFVRIKRERYQVLSLLGKGGSGKVYHVEKEDGRNFALKCVRLERLDDVILKGYINEIYVLQALSDKPHIIHLYEWEFKNEVLYMLMEKGDNDLHQFLRSNKTMSNDEIRSLWKQMLLAVNTIHKQGIIHTDLKPANFIFVESTLKLIDFGIAKGIEDNCTSTQRACLLGTLNYMAPESVSAEVTDEGAKKNFKIRRATDIWSLGCILYFIVYRKLPFQHITNEILKIMEIINGKEINFPDIDDKDLLDSIKGCLKRNPRERYTIEQLLAHPFLTGGAHICSQEDGESTDIPVHRSVDELIHNIKESTINSPNSLLRINNCFMKSKTDSLQNMQKVRKTIF
eukprot:gene16034-17654_t